VDLAEERRGLVVVVEKRQGPSPALESAPAVLILRAESLHHSIDGDVRDGRQFHGFVLSLVVVFSFDRTEVRISSVERGSVLQVHSASFPNIPLLVRARGTSASRLRVLRLIAGRVS